MEIITTIISLIFSIIILVSPILILRIIIKSNHNDKLLWYLILSFIICGILITLMTWCNYESNKILLKNLNGYVFFPDSNSYKVDLKNVLPNDLAKAKKIEKNIMGIGWPLKAIFSFILFTSYIYIVYGVYYLKNKLKIKKQTLT